VLGELSPFTGEYEETLFRLRGMRERFEGGGAFVDAGAKVLRQETASSLAKNFRYGAW